MPKLRVLLRIKEAAEELGVWTMLPRNREWAGSWHSGIPCITNRLFKLEDLGALLKQVAVARKKATN